MRVKGGLVTMIYRKSLRLSNGEKAGRATGDIVNLQSVDAVRIGDLAQYGHIGWSGPFQVSHQTDGRDAPPLTSHRSCSRSFRCTILSDGRRLWASAS